MIGKINKFRKLKEESSTANTLMSLSMELHQDNLCLKVNKAINTQIFTSQTQRFSKRHSSLKHLGNWPLRTKTIWWNTRWLELKARKRRISWIMLFLTWWVVLHIMKANYTLKTRSCPTKMITALHILHQD